MHRGIRVYRRQELYELVWAKPMRDAAKDFKVSDVALKKTCKKLSVPTPPKGYWNQVAAGKKVFQIPLPELPAGRRSELHVWRTIDDSREPSAEALAAAERERREGEPVDVGTKLTKPHPLVIQTRDALRNATPFDGCVSSRDSALNVTVAPNNVDRALRIMDALLKALEARSLCAEVTAPSHRTEWGRTVVVPGRTIIRVGEDSVAVKLNEAVDVVRPAAPVWQQRYPRSPTGRLVLTMFGGGQVHRWYDHKHRKLESHLNEFIPNVYIVADWAKQKRLADEKRERQEEEARRRRDEAEEQRRQRQKRIKGLDHWLARWRRVRDIREFASQIRGLVHASAMKISEGGPLHEQVAWMLAYADELDPLRELRGELEGVDARGEGLCDELEDEAHP